MKRVTCSFALGGVEYFHLRMNDFLTPKYSKRYMSGKEALRSPKNFECAVQAPPRNFLITFTDKVYQHIGSNAHSTIVSFGSPILTSKDSPQRCINEDFTMQTLCLTLRKALSDTLSATFWQLNMLNNQQIQFQCTRVPDANASMLFNVLLQHVISFIESLKYEKGTNVKRSSEVYAYELFQSYCTCTPDARKAGLQTNAHYLIFKRTTISYRRSKYCLGQYDHLMNEKKVYDPKSLRRVTESTTRKQGQKKISPCYTQSISSSFTSVIPENIHTTMENFWEEK